jgi:hypothetical protein
MTTALQRDDLLRDLEGDWESCFASGKVNNVTDVTLSIVGILASLAATVLVSTDASKWIIASVAAVPAACASLQKVVDFRGRSHWYFRYASHVRALASSLKFDNAPDLSDYARKWGALDVEMDKDWSQIGRSGAKPSARRQVPALDPRSKKSRQIE